MDWLLFGKGLAIGFSIAAPVGPVGILCIHRTLNRGRLAGFVSGLGAATADALYGLVAALGLSFLSALLLNHQTLLRLLGGLFLTGLGLRLISRRPPPERSAEGASPPAGLLAGYATTFLLTVSNPMTILAFSAVITGLGAIQGQAVLLVAGVFLGSALWWLLLALGAGLFRERIGPRVMSWVNSSAGLVVTGFGIAILLAGLRGL